MEKQERSGDEPASQRQMRKSEERIRAVLDEKSFIELREHTGGAAGGYGLIEGRLVFIYAQDPDDQGGIMTPRQAEKIEKIYDMAEKMHAPVIELLDSAGVQVASAMDSLMAFGRVLRKKSELKGIIPIITAVFGNCGGSQAVCAQMSDFLLLENQAQLYLIPSDAVIGNKDEELQSADHQEKSGNIDFMGTAEELAEKIRSLISFLPKDNLGGYEYEAAEDSLNRAAENFSQLHGENAVIELADDRIFLRRKALSESGIASGLIRMNGQTVGVIANENPEVSAKGLREAAEWLRFCGAFRIPMLTICEASSFNRDERNAAHLLYSCRELIFAKACVESGTVTIIKKAEGLPGMLFAGRSADSDLILAETDAEVKVMDSRAAAEILGGNAEEFGAEQNSLQAAENRGLIDLVVRPEEMRQQVCGAFEMQFSGSAYSLADQALSAERKRAWSIRK